MGMREEFEAAMPKPEGVYWYEDYGRYMTTSDHLKCIDYNGKWEGWQASRAVPQPKVCECPSGVRNITDGGHFPACTACKRRIAK